jgi:hypothetical protein
MVRGLGSGLTSESADAIRAILRNDLPAGIEGFVAPAGAVGCSAWPGQEAGVPRSERPAGACHPSTTEKEMALFTQDQVRIKAEDFHCDHRIPGVFRRLARFLWLSPLPGAHRP